MTQTPDNDRSVEAEVGRRRRNGDRACCRVQCLAPLLVLLIGVSGSPLFAQADQYEKKGFNPEHSYQIGNVDAVNVFNGALTINLGIAQRYPVGGSLSYGLNLVYTGPKFLVHEHGNDCSPNPCTDPVDYFAEPDPWFNAGFGWMLNPGMIVEANALPPEYLARNSPLNQFHSRYIAPDGSEHYFYDELHENEPETVASFTRDNTYLRLKTPNPNLKTIDFPNGEVHEFEEIHPDWGTWRVTRISDGFGNEVNFTYSNATWTISDSIGRTHVIHMRHVAELEHYSVTDGWIVDSVEMASFGGQSSTWDLQYTTLDNIPNGTGLEEGCFGHDQDENPPRQSEYYFMEMLTRFQLPDGSSYRMGEAGEVWYDPRCTGADEPGVIEAMKLPTEGSIEWQYGFRDMPVNNEETRGNQFPDPVVMPSNGVVGRTLKDAAGQVMGTWSYTAEVWPFPPTPTTDVREVRVHVEDPAGDCVTHYFDADPGWTSQGPDSGWAYGLPFAQSQPSGSRFLSTVTTDAADGSGKCTGTTLRETYVRYDHDELPEKPGQIDPWWLANLHNTNRRLIEERTVFVDDGNRYAGTVYSDFDGLGHYRTATTNGNFASGNVRTTTTNYNPGNGTYPGSFVPPGVGAPWVLTTYDETSVSEGGTTYKQEFCFNPATGFLDRKRILAEPSQQSNDVIVHYNMDPRFEVPGGMVQFESYYGGDVQNVNSGDLCFLFLPSEDQYEIEHQPLNGYGTVRWIRYNDANGGWTGVAPIHRNIDPNTALPSQTIDVGLLTDWTYDGLGRPTLVEPETAHKGAQTQYMYTPAVGTSAAQVDILEKSNNGGTVLTERRLHFDGHGRLAREERKLPGGAFNRRDTEYTPRGFIESVSTTWTGSPASQTTYSGYDQFGRPGSITSPDGSVVTFDYTGVRKVERTVSVNGSAATTTEEYDRQGRLIKVAEPTGTVTTYGYDPADRLTSVSMVAGNSTQTRTFSYDGRGFLLSESHPEKSGPVSYSNHDAFGNPGGKVDGTSDLTIEYDRVGRVELIERTSDGQNLKQFEYATGNSGTNKSQGKLVKAWRHHDHSALSGIPDVTIEEEYIYRGPGGLPTRRTTRKNGATELFRLGTSYNDLGLPEQVCYPLECGAGGTTTVQYGYAQGLVTSVTGYASNISYHPNLMLASIAHTNGVTDVWTADPNRIRRPSRIQTTGVIGATPFDTGTFQYDGAGNITAMGSDVFQYDPLSRLTSGTAAGGQFTELNSYDPFGNRIAATSLGLSRQNPTDPATNRLQGTSQRPIGYDQAGNLTAWGTASYSYDPLDTMVRLQDGGVDEVYLYTADDERVAVLQTDGSSQTSGRWMLRDLNSQVVRTYTQQLFNNTPIWEKDYIRRGTQLLARESQGGTHHAHLDHLGTPRLWTHPDASLLSRHDYLPFGEEVTITTHNEELQFTGHERDEHASGGCSGTATVNNQTLSNGEDFLGCDGLTSENTTVAGSQEVRFTSAVEIGLRDGFNVNSGANFVAEIDGSAKLDRQDLDYMHARYASPWLGRFGSVDPVDSGAPRSPQSWNRYAYVQNQPINFLDLNGKYRSDFHQDLTRVLALAAGYSPTEATAIAEANLAVDRGARSPFLSFEARKNFHFTTEERRNELFNQAKRTGTADDIGTFLHSLQDSFSHSEHGPLFGHLIDGTAPDRTANDPEKALRAAIATFDSLAEFNSQGSPVTSFDEIRSLVFEFLEMEEEAPGRQDVLKRIEKFIEELDDE